MYRMAPLHVNRSNWRQFTYALHINLSLESQKHFIEAEFFFPPYFFCSTIGSINTDLRTCTSICTLYHFKPNDRFQLHAESMRRYRSRKRPPYDDGRKFWVGRGAGGGNIQETEALVKVNRMWARSMVAVKHLYLLLGCMVTSSTEFQQEVSNCMSKGSGTIFIHTTLKNKEMQRKWLQPKNSVFRKARSTAWVCGRSLAAIAGSNPALGSMDVYLLRVMCVAR